MLVTQITTHVSDALGRLLQQYQGKPRMMSLISGPAQQIQDLENAIFALDAGRQLWNGTTSPAVGAQLDGIGQLVGIERNGLTDAQYILFIFGKIAENFSDTTVQTILNVIGYLFQAQTLVVQEIYPAGIAFEVFGSSIPPSLWPTANSLIQAALGEGIQLVFGAASSSTNVFRFAAPNVTGQNNGFSSVNDPSEGGGFIGLI